MKVSVVGTFMDMIYPFEKSDFLTEETEIYCRNRTYQCHISPI